MVVGLISSSLAPFSEIVTVPPTTQYVPYNINKNVTFNCEVIGTTLIWEFNGIQLPKILLTMDVFIEDELGSGETGNITRNSTLLVFVDESANDRNKSRIRCFTPVMESIEIAYLWTYGKSCLVPCYPSFPPLGSLSLICFLLVWIYSMYPFLYLHHCVENVLLNFLRSPIFIFHPSLIVFVW